MSSASRHANSADRHEVLSGRFSHVVEVVALVAIMLGDAVAFQQVVAVAMEKSSTTVTWTLIIALSAAATLSMHLAGVSARRRQAAAQEAGRLWAVALVVGWLLLGGMALWFRLQDAHLTQSAEPSGGVFGAATATGSGTAVPLAFLMLALYLVGGVTAYGIGYGMHNPARAAYRRVEREHRKATRAYRWAIWRRQRALARLARPTRGMVSQRVLRAAISSQRPTLPIAPLPGTDHPQTSALDRQDELAARRELSRARARSQADQLREVTRHRLAAALADPARTSGVFEGHPPAECHPYNDIPTGVQL